MCSVVEITNTNEYYIHYHSPESLDTNKSLEDDPSSLCHPLFVRDETLSDSLDVISLAASNEENDLLVEEIVGNNEIGLKESNDDDPLGEVISECYDESSEGSNEVSDDDRRSTVIGNENEEHNKSDSELIDLEKEDSHLVKSKNCESIKAKESAMSAEARIDDLIKG